MDQLESSWLASWAPPESRLGALQRGRGDGFRAALVGGAEAAAEVSSCVVEEPRWDSQVESRDRYYAQLLHALPADLGPIAARLAEFGKDGPRDRSGLSLPLGVTTELAALGHAGASEILANLTATTQLWRPCLEELETVGGERLIAAVVSPEHAAALVASIGPAALADAIARIAAPWAAWSETIPTLRSALARQDADQETSRPRHDSLAPSSLDPSMSVEALLQIDLPPRRMSELSDLLDARRDSATTSALLHAATTARHGARMTALRLLGRRGCVDLLDDAAAFLRSEATNGRSGRHDLRSGYLRYLEELPAAIVLPLARAWFHEPWPLSLSAGQIFARHATAEDRPILETAGAAALVAGEMYRLCHVLEALEIIADPASIGLLCTVVRDAPYSYARQRALAALVPHVDQAEVSVLLTDALWDCEPNARWIACEQADLDSPLVRARLDEIAADGQEDEDIRELAREVSSSPS